MCCLWEMATQFLSRGFSSGPSGDKRCNDRSDEQQRQNRPEPSSRRVWRAAEHRPQDPVAALAEAQYLFLCQGGASESQWLADRGRLECTFRELTANAHHQT